MRLHELIRAEFDRRRARNPRHSLRAFAATLGVHHSALRRLFAGRRATPARVTAIGRKLGLGAGEIARCEVEEDAAAVLALVRAPRFRADSRWIAERSGVRLDRVNVALHHLVHTRRLRLVAPHLWNVEIQP